MSEKFTNYLERQTARYTTKSEGTYTLFIVYGDNFNINRFARKLELEYSLGDECFKDFKAKIHDETADEVIDLINRASKEGKTYTWLSNRIPEFFEITKGNSQNYSREYVFPSSKRTNKVYLKKPTTLWEDIKDKLDTEELFSILKQYKELKDKYGGENYSVLSDINKEMKETDSKKEKLKLKLDYDKASKLEKELNFSLNISRVYNLYAMDLLNFCPTNLKELEEAVDKSQDKYSKEIYKEIQQEKAVNLSGNKVLPLSKDQEAYIRKIIGKGDTKEWAKKKEERSKVPFDIKQETNKFTYSNEPYVKRNLRESYSPERKLYTTYVRNLKNYLEDYKEASQDTLNYQEKSRINIILKNLNYVYGDTTKESALSMLNEALDFVKSVDHSSKESKELYQKIRDLLENFKKEIKETRKPLRVPDRRFKRN